jgi:biotin transporter BioY
MAEAGGQSPPPVAPVPVPSQHGATLMELLQDIVSALAMAAFVAAACIWLPVLA